MVKTFKLNTPEGTHSQELKPNGNILNLSNYTLSSSQKHILNKGLKFIPTPHTISKQNIIQSTAEFSRRLKLADFFEWLPHTEKLPFQAKSDWVPPDEDIDPEVLNCITQHTQQIIQLKPVKDKSNITQTDIKAIKSLKKQ